MAMKLNFLYGIRWQEWWRLLRRTRFDIDVFAWPRAALISVFALQNSWLARKDIRVNLDDVEVHPPIFILGHWRSGTTHLHYLMNQDPRLASPTTYQCAFPHSFLHSESWHRPWLDMVGPRGRPQDRMEVHLDSPQEDELALELMCLRSPYLGWAFPRLEAHFRRYLSFADVCDEGQQDFERALLLFVRKLSYYYRRPLVLKSPGHTARLPLLMRAFPKARYVMLTRDPYEVFQSSLHTYRSWKEAFAFLQRANEGGLEERVLSLYEDMYEQFFAHEASLPPERYYVLRFEDLKADPIYEMRKLYAGIGLTEFPEQQLRDYLARIGGYQQNRYPPIAPEWRAAVAERWAPSFQAWGYPT
jgi:hypothetical protein